MRTIILFILFLLVAQVFAACPNSCSGHGSCVGNTCSCQTGWYGNDCSINEIPLNDNQIVSGSVGTFSWGYYYIENPHWRETLEISLNQTSTTGDCDIYIRPTSIPTRSVYYAREISTNRTIQWNVPNLEQGRWYIGVYGFSACSFNLRAHITGGCPNDCSGHGTCSASGTCSCESGWSGADCSIGTQTLSIGTPLDGQSVAADEWKDYRVQMTTGNTLIWTMTQSGGGDCDLFVRFGQPATLFQWDYLNATTNRVTTLVVTDAAHGWWYAGVYGFSACQFSIVVEVGSYCPNQCSEHGRCAGSTCVCNAGYTGEACETKAVGLGNEEQVSGYVLTNFWNWYTYTSNSADNLVITVDQEEVGTQDCDLYVRAGARPSRFNYDYQETSVDKTFSLTIPDPGQAAWYIGVYGWSSCRYTLVAVDSSTCPNNCNSHGRCDSEGHCICNPGWGGDACEAGVTTLQNNVMVGGSNTLKVSNNVWNFFSIQPTPGSTSLHIQMKELDSEGYVWLFAGKEIPSLRHYDVADQDLSSALHHITISLDSTAPQLPTYYIGVYGNPFLPSDSQSSYEIIAWYAPF